MELRQTLTGEFASRRPRNARYSQRTFARDLGTAHATLSQVLRSRRVLSPRPVRQFGRQFHLSPADIADACEQHHADAVLRLARLVSFRPNSCGIATRTGLPLDAVNAALARLLHQRQLLMSSTKGTGPFPLMPNPVVRRQIVSPEPDRPAAFYQKLFAWKISQALAPGYRELLSGSATGVDSGVWPAPPGGKSFVQLFGTAPDLDPGVSQAIAPGARTIIPKSILPDGDAMAALLDPTGLSFAVCQLRTAG